jgi:beta-lactamase regulating signal transducer with metallopeptidase domain
MGLLPAEAWLIRVAIGGGLLLLIARVAMSLTRQPVRRQRLGELALMASLILAALCWLPAWLLVPLPYALVDSSGLSALARESDVRSTPDAQKATDSVRNQFEPGKPMLEVPDAEAPVDGLDWAVPAWSVPAPAESLQAEGPLVTADSSTQSASFLTWPMLLCVYGIGAGLLFARLLIGHLALARLLRRTLPAPPHVVLVLNEIAGRETRVRVRVAECVRVPFSCGVLRPTIVLPRGFAERAPQAVLRWVLAHELTHVRQRDARGGLLAALAQIVYFPLPWLWSLCRQVRLCQEYVADAAAVALCGNAEDYAQFLLSWAALPAPPAVVAGVSGRPTDLYRRITMLLKSPHPVERRCPRHWIFLAGTAFLALAVAGSGIGRQVVAASEPEQQSVREDDSKKDEKQDSDRKQQEEKARKLLQQLAPGLQDFKPLMPDWGLILNGPDDETLKELLREQERVRAQLQGLLVNPGAMPGAPVITGIPGQRATGRLGVKVEKPGETLVDQLDLPKGMGLSIEFVQPDSAAAKAGIKVHDILLELDGKPVSSDVGEFLKQLSGEPSDKSIKAVVLRRGRRETIKDLKLPEKADNAFLTLPAAPFQLQTPQPVRLIGPKDMSIPGGFGFPAKVAAPRGGVITTTMRTDDHFTTRHEEGSLIITLSGKVEKGKSKVSEIQIQDGRESHKYDSIDKVPETYRDKVKHLSDLIEKDNVEIRIRGFDGDTDNK